ncbi:hypothetical protein AB0M20_30925, partial [Actinoplanes sp. NPDC051633]|uniref:hypothetical protein n=1 Tax=Actinoplanes sp. NPDC051633 TaxID=3155670 RepID=UPI00341C88EB
RASRPPRGPGMTVREVSVAAGSVAGPDTVDEVRRLAAEVDRALWSPGRREDTDAWGSVRAVRSGLARRGFLSRLRAVLDPRPLLPVSARRKRRGSPSAD